MGSVTRFWILDAAVGESDTLELPAGLDPARTLVVARESELCGVGALPFGERLREVRGALERWAAAHPEAQLLVLADAGWVAAAAALAVGLEHESIRSAAVTLDWPAEPGERPGLIGLDLDWQPPFSAKGRPKFPGGPGTAAAERG